MTKLLSLIVACVLPLLEAHALSLADNPTVDRKDELRSAIVFLNKRCEIRDLVGHRLLRPTGWALAGLGLIPFTKALIEEQVLPMGSANAPALMKTSVALIFAGLALQVADRAWPVYRLHALGANALKTNDEEYLRLFFSMSSKQQLRFATNNDQVGDFLIQLAESHGFRDQTSLIR